MRIRTKLWYASVGSYTQLAIFGAYAHSVFLLALGLTGSIGSYYFAEYLLKQEQEDKNV